MICKVGSSCQDCCQSTVHSPGQDRNNDNSIRLVLSDKKFARALELELELDSTDRMTLVSDNKVHSPAVASSGQNSDSSPLCSCCKYAQLYQSYQSSVRWIPECHESWLKWLLQSSWQRSLTKQSKVTNGNNTWLLAIPLKPISVSVTSQDMCGNSPWNCRHYFESSLLKYFPSGLENLSGLRKSPFWGFI